MAKSQFDVLKEEFQNECKVINLRYEYEGYIGKEQWAIISVLTEKEILEKYSELISDYIPFLTLSLLLEKSEMSSEEMRKNIICDQSEALTHLVMKMSGQSNIILSLSLIPLNPLF